MKDYISLVLPQLLVLVNLQNEKKSDAAIILGRLGLFCYNQVVPLYNQFAQHWYLISSSSIILQYFLFQ